MIIGVGIDLIEIPRIAKAMERQRFLPRIYTEYEQGRIRRKGASSAAGYFAAKEAAMKALGVGMAVPFASIGVVNDPRGKPMIEFTGASLERAREMGVRAAHVSISHSKEMATAVVVLED
jgi:holo-[acyl-carrier protein] synthase